MKAVLYKALALLLCLSLCLGLTPPAFSEGEQNESSAKVGTNDLTFAGDSCIGTLAARMLEQDHNLEPMPGTITDIFVTGTTATVELSTDRAATLVVAVYQDGGLQMLGSGNTTVNAGDSTGTLVINIDEMPEYYVTGAYLLDAKTSEPISQEYISRYYTKEFQDFLASTTADYDENLVLNLDENEDTNYVVYYDDTVRVTEQENVNQINDNGDGSYTIRNAEERIRSLKVGDSFSCTTMDGSVIVFRVGAISVSGTTVTLTEDKTATLEDIFEYVKIEDASDGTGGTVDTTEMDAGVSYVGDETTVLNTYESGGELLFGSNVNEELDAPILNTQVSISEEEQTVTFSSAPARNIDQTVGSKFKFKIENEKASGEITFGVSVNCNFYKSFSWTYHSVSIDFSTKTTLEILSISEFEKEIKLGEPQVPVGASGLKASFPISFVFKANAKIAITEEMKMTLGFAVDSDYGFINLSSLPTLEGMKLDISGKVYIGFKIEAKISTFFSLAATSISGEVGFEATGKMKGWPFELGSTSKKHECAACIEGSIKAQCGFKVKLSTLSDKISTSWTIAEFEWKLTDFYYSLTNQVYGWGTCPYISYGVKIHVLKSDVSNPAGTPVDGTMVLINYANSGMPALAEDSYPITDDEGIAETFLPSGQYKISTSTINGLRGEATLTIKDFAKEVNIWLETAPIASGIWGDNITWKLDADGVLTISGSGEIRNMYWWSTEQAWRHSRYADKIKKVVILDGVTGIGADVFYNCDNIEKIIIPSSVTEISGSPLGYPNGLTSAGPIGSGCSIEFGWTDTIPDNAFETCTNLQSIIFPNGVTSIGQWSFAHCHSLTNITIPSSVVSIGSNAFHNCRNLTKITLPSSVTNVGSGAFSWCYGLTTAGPIGNGYSIEYGWKESIPDCAFAECELLHAVIPAEITSIGYKAFYACANLQDIMVAKDNSTYSSIDGVLFKNNGTELICFPCTKSGTYSIPSSVVSIEDWSFYNCSGLTNLVIPSSVEKIGNGAFYECIGLETVTTQPGIKSIGKWSFLGCTSLKNMTIPSGVTSIDNAAFCMSGLENVTIPSGVLNIGYYAFGKCSDLVSVTVNKGVSGIDWWAFDESNNIKDIYYYGTEEEWYLNGFYCSSYEATIHYLATETDSNTAYLTAAARYDDSEALFDEKQSLNNLESHNAILYAEAMAKYTASDMTDGSEKLACFNELVPGSSYVLLVVKDEESDDLFDASNLLYIAQLSADENGQISMVYVPRTDSTQKTALAFGESTSNLKDSKVSVEQREDGILQVTVSYGDLELTNDTDYTYGIETGEETVIVSVKGRGEYAGTISVEADKLPHTPSIPIWENDASTPGESNVVIHCTKCGAILSQKTISAELDFVLPTTLMTIENEAFSGAAFTFVKLPEQAVSIGWHAFADCPNLMYIYIPAATTEIDENAFGEMKDLTILGVSGKTAETYASEHGFRFVPIA